MPFDNDSIDFDPDFHDLDDDEGLGEIPELAQYETVWV